MLVSVLYFLFHEFLLSKIRQNGQKFDLVTKVLSNGFFYKYSKSKKRLKSEEDLQEWDVHSRVSFISPLSQELKAAKWLEHISEVLNQTDPISLDVIRGCVDQGIGLRKKQGENYISSIEAAVVLFNIWHHRCYFYWKVLLLEVSFYLNN